MDSKFNQRVFWIDRNSDGIFELFMGTLKDYVLEYGRDETTTPNGVGPREHLRGAELWSWGDGGNHPYLVKRYDNIEEAEYDLLQAYDYNAGESDNAPVYHLTREEAEKELAEMFGDIGD